MYFYYYPQIYKNDRDFKDKNNVEALKLLTKTCEFQQQKSISMTIAKINFDSNKKFIKVKFPKHHKNEKKMTTNLQKKFPKQTF